MCEARGFTIAVVHGDNEFDVKTIREFLLPAILEIYGKNEYVGPIERSTRIVKNNCRTMTHDTPYMRVLKVMVIALLKCAVYG